MKDIKREREKKKRILNSNDVINRSKKKLKGCISMSSLPFALKRKDAFIIMMLYSPPVVGEFITASFQNYMINDNLHTCVKMCNAINELINRRWYSDSVKFYERYH